MNKYLNIGNKCEWNSCDSFETKMYKFQVPLNNKEAKLAGILQITFNRRLCEIHFKEQLDLLKKTSV